MELPEELKEERDELISLVYEAFDGVTRDDGVSWSQADLLDGRIPTNDELRVAGEKDKDSNWQELVSSYQFYANPANWWDLDSIGYRYYLPAAMVFCLDGGEPESLASSLTMTNNSWQDDQREFNLRQWLLLDEQQKACVSRFLAFTAGLYGQERFNDWKTAYDSYWHKFSN